MNRNQPATQIDIRDFLAMLWRRKWLILIPLPLVTALTFAGSFLIQPEYQSSTIIQINHQVQLIGELQRLVGERARVSSMQGRARSDLLQSIFNELTSTRFVELLQERMQLVYQPHIEALAVQYTTLQPSMTIEMARLLIFQDELKKSVSVEWASGDQIRITAVSTDVTNARDMANNLGDILIAEKVRRDANQIQDKSTVAYEALEIRDREVQTVQSEITRVEQVLARLRSSDAQTAEANRSEIEEEADQTNTEINDLNQQERRLVGSLTGSTNLSANQLTLDDSETKKTTRRELRNRLRQIGILLSRYIWSDPQVINFKVRQNNLLGILESENQTLVNQQYAELDRSIRQEMVNLFNVRSRIDYLKAKKPILQTALNDLTPVTDLIPEYEVQLTQLQNEFEAAIINRDRFRIQIEGTEIEAALQALSSNYRKVEPAKLALAPFKPNRTRIILLGIILGLALGGTGVLLVELMDNSFKKIEDVENTLGLRVLAVTPKVDFDKRLISR